MHGGAEEDALLSVAALLTPTALRLFVPLSIALFPRPPSHPSPRRALGGLY